MVGYSASGGARFWQRQLSAPRAWLLRRVEGHCGDLFNHRIQKFHCWRWCSSSNGQRRSGNGQLSIECRAVDAGAMSMWRTRGTSASRSHGRWRVHPAMGHWALVTGQLLVPGDCRGRSWQCLCVDSGNFRVQNSPRTGVLSRQWGATAPVTGNLGTLVPRFRRSPGISLDGVERLCGGPLEYRSPEFSADGVHHQMGDAGRS